MTKPIYLCVDPGHGMGNIRAGKYDPGASAGGVTEAEIALQFATTLVYLAKQRGVRTWMTRDDSTDHNPVGTRDNRAAAEGCNLFLSIHCNALNASATGIETFYRNAEDKRLADAVQKATLKAIGLKDRGVKVDTLTQHKNGLAVMAFGPPACLVELGFIDNPVDRKKLLNRDVRIAWADAVIDAIESAYPHGV